MIAGFRDKQALKTVGKTAGCSAFRGPGDDSEASCHARPSGFSLVEVLVASVLLTITSIGVMGVLSSAYIVVQRAVINHRATELARDKVDQIENIPIEDLFPTDYAGSVVTGCDSLPDLEDAQGFLITKAKPVGPGVVEGPRVEVSGLATCVEMPPNLGSDGVALAPEACLHPRYEFFKNEYDAGKWWSATDLKPVDDPLLQDLVWNPTRGWVDCKDIYGGTQPLPKPGQMGFYERWVKVTAYQQYDADCQASPPCPLYSVVGDAYGFNAPVKTVDVTVRWTALGETQQYTLHHLTTRLIPKKAFFEQSGS